MWRNLRRLTSQRPNYATRRGFSPMIDIHTMRKALPLKRLILNYALGYLLLVLATGVLGSAGLFAWHQASEESLRLNQLIEELQAMRGALYQEMKEVLDLTLLADREAPSQLREHERSVVRHLDALHSITSGSEAESIRKLENAYRTVQDVTDAIVRDWDHSPVGIRHEWLESRLESDALRNYEVTFTEIENLLSVEQAALQSRQKWLLTLSPLVLIIPLSAAIGLLLWSRYRLQRDIVLPISAIQHATEMISLGQLEHRAPEHGVEELSRLSQSINQMASDLAESRALQLRSEKQATLAMLVPLMAHNIRNPLASIRATAQVIADPGLPADARDGLTGIIATVDRLEAWTHSLLSYLHPLEPQRVQCDTARLLSIVIMLLQEKITVKNLQVHVMQVDQPVEAWLDEQLVEQALQGIVANAIEASPDGGSIAVQVHQNPDAVLFIIEDHGPGMPFAPSAPTLAPGPSTKRFGTGLGIPFAMKVCEAHGGFMRFIPGESVGTRVELHIPLHHEPST
jgi:signal transduction histidine kinase